MKLLDIELDVIEDSLHKRKITIELPKDIQLGKHRFVIIIEERFSLVDEEDLSPDIDIAYKNEIDKRLEEMEKNPHPGFTMKEVLERLEKRVGKELQV